jgi:hypothetical protein
MTSQLFFPWLSLLFAGSLLAQAVPTPAIRHSTLLGGGGPDYMTDAGLAITRGADGTVYVLGQTSSLNFPHTAVIGPQTEGFGSFVNRFSADGRTVLQATFIGGISARAVAVDAAGNIYLAGETGGALPGLSSAQPEFGGALDAFVLKLNPAGNAVVYATYLGGSDLELGRSLAVDAAGAAYLAGWTSSTNFPATAGAAQTVLGGNYDAFVAKLAPDGKATVYATYVGGARSESGAHLTLDAQRRVWLVGRSASAHFGAPGLPLPWEPTRWGTSATTTQNAYVARLSAEGDRLEALAFLAGDGVDAAAKIVLDSAGAPVVLGYTESANLPITPGVYQSTYRGAQDLFVAKFSPQLDVLSFCTYVGSPNTEAASTAVYAGGYTVGEQFIEGTSLVTEGGGLALDPAGHILLSGSTGASDWPEADATAPNNDNAVVAHLAADGSRLLWLSLLGGQTEDYGTELVADGPGGAWVTGEANRPTLPPYFPTTPDATQPSFGGGISDAFVTRLGPRPATPFNDDFAQAPVLNSPRATVRLNWLGASQEIDEPLHAGQASLGSVWWQWTAPSDGRLQLDTLGSGFDTLLAVYTGTEVTNLTALASNDDGAETTTSRVRLPVTAGTTYRVAVADKAGAAGDLVLNVTFSEPPNDDFAQRISLTGLPVTATGSSRHATPETRNDTAHASVPAGQSVWWEWTSPTNGFIAVSTAGSSFNTLLGIFTGDAIDTLTEVQSNDNVSDQPGAFTSQVTFQATAGTRYAIVVDGYYSQSGAIQLGIFPGDPPLNDNFANRAPLVGYFARVTAANINATAEASAGEPALQFVDSLGQPLEPPAGATVWWTWTAPTNGRVRLSTADVTFDTRLAVFTGVELNALTRVAANNNRGENPNDRSSLVTFEATAGTTYQIALDGGLYNGNAGRFTLTLALERPPKILPGTTQRQADGSLSFSVEAVPDRTLILEASDDLRSWTELASQPVVDPTFTWSLAAAFVGDQRFFRLVDPTSGQ